MNLNITIQRTKLTDAIIRESATKAQLFSENPSEFERLVITQGESDWLFSKVSEKAKGLYPALHPYIESVVYNHISEVPFVFTMADTFDDKHGPAIETTIHDVLVKSVAAEWFWEKGKPELQKELLGEVSTLIEQIKIILYRWRVVRSEQVKAITEIVRIQEEYKAFNYVLIAIPKEMVITQAIEDVNAALKVRLPSTEEFEKYRLDNSHLSLLNRIAARGSSVIADKSQAYIVLWKDDATAEDVQEVVNEIKETKDTAQGNADYFLMLFKMPDNFNRQSVKTISDTIRDTLSYGLMGNYFNEIGMVDAAEYYHINRENSLMDVMSLLHRRTKPIRRKANFFS